MLQLVWLVGPSNDRVRSPDKCRTEVLFHTDTQWMHQCMQGCGLPGLPFACGRVTKDYKAYINSVFGVALLELPGKVRYWKADLETHDNRMWCRAFEAAGLGS